VLAHTHVPDRATIYHLAVGAHGHTHLQCARCARMFDIPIDWLDELAARVDQRLGFALDPGHAALLGTCRDCQASVQLSVSREPSATEEGVE
jgi:Fur family ferric uptake transcriptional regulator